MGEWVEVGQWVGHQWFMAEVRRSRRSPAEAEALHRGLWLRRLMRSVRAWGTEDDGMPTCRWGDGPCAYPARCYRAERCLGAD